MKRKSLKVLINDFHYQKCPTLGGFGLFLLLIVPSIFYTAAICTKNLLYTMGILKEKKVLPYIICVGNLTTGGVGKTPIVCEIANYCANVLGKKTAIVSRGYGAKLNNKKVNIIKDDSGKIYFEDGSICGDEALLSAKNTENCIVLTSKNRVLAANFAHNNFGAQVVILDDGFSNRKIKKDFSVLVVDSKKQFGNGFLLPSGPLREPLCEAKRADFIIVSNKDDKNAKESLNKISKYLKTNATTLCNFCADYFYNIKNGLQIVPDGQKAAAFCAIGQPEQFYSYLKNAYDLVFTKDFSDHYSYDKKDLEKLAQEADNQGVRIILTTQKDEVKIAKHIGNLDNAAFVSLKLKAEFSNYKLYDEIKNGIQK